MDEQNNKPKTSASEKVSNFGCGAGIIGAVLLILGIATASTLFGLGIAIIGCIAIIIGFIAFYASPGLETPEEKKRSQASQEAYVNRTKYNDLKYTCPMCGSHKIKNIGTAKKVGGVVAVGLASQNIGKNYQCDDCNYKW